MTALLECLDRCDSVTLHMATDSDQEGQTALEAELTSMKMRDLVQKARDAGISENEILESQDAAYPKNALVSVLVECRLAAQAELGSMRMRELVLKAKEWGVDEEALYDAQDDERPKEAIVELLMSSYPTSITRSNDA